MAQQEPNYWLMKSEPNAYSINDLATEKTTLWDGIRNYQARNYMRSMKVGEKAFFYHSNCKPPGIVGLMEVIDTEVVDPTQFDSKSKYFDPKSLIEKPTWDCVKVKYLGMFQEKLSLNKIKDLYKPEELKLVQKGNRLSIIPVNEKTALNLLNILGKYI
ncbi:EVE domain-containing protein [Prochlorococcus sp. MIT 1223]|uniref:EVE domain-containing protein n=1 Tax=Prochlorococcus sp. MIT 1223 TaxID=3096217 RepID=UPI002A74C576|nr:EVE domain-containing protein [Prochlorococcus sp. MIT 1223]